MINKKILVTGGAGFVGSHLCERLVHSGCRKVVSLDNYFTGNESNHVHGVEYIRGNTRDIDLLVDFEPDLVFHLGEYSRVEQSFEDVDLVYEFNKVGTFRVLEFCKRHNAKLIYAGSSTKFGDGGLGRTASPYAWTKASNTELVINYGNWYGLNYAITYFYNVYGPREISEGKYATLIAIFAKKYLSGEAFTVVSPGTQQRNFTHIDDIVDGLILVGQEGVGDEFGIGDPQAYSILEVANMFGNEIHMVPPRQGNRLSAEVVSAKTEALGWKPKRKLIDYINEIKNA